MARLLFAGFCKNSINPVTNLTNNSIRCLSTSLPLKSEDGKKGFMEKFLGPESSIASKSFTNRWAMFAPAFATHVCLGAPYGNFSLT